ncbi:MAG: SirB2 family protein [Mariprofundaceae bacterium]
MYPLLKQVHIICAVLTFTQFFLRGVWTVRTASVIRKSWMRIFPPIIDSVLMLTGIALMWETGQFPGSEDWVTAKVAAVLIYVALGIVALNRGGTHAIRTVCWMLALLFFAYIVAVSRTHQSIPWL